MKVWIQFFILSQASKKSASDWKDLKQNYLIDTLANDNHDLAGYGSKKESDDYSDDNVHFGNESLEVIYKLGFSY